MDAKWSNKTDALDLIVGSSPVMQAMKDEIRRIASKDVPVLLIGQSGTGKELVARAIHELSSRAGRPYVVTHSAAVPTALFESEFFGYAPGAFTGADRHGRRGRLEQANGGTLFLDEIGEMPLEAQVKLLRVLQDGRFERLGGSSQQHSDFRLVSATHRDVPMLVHQERFRLDLYYRIGAVTVRLPALAERRSDIPQLAQAFLEAFSARHGIGGFGLTAGGRDYLMAQPWPGNVRQLKHEVERAAIYADTSHLDTHDFRNVHSGHLALAEIAGPWRQVVTVREARGEVELSMIQEALARFHGNKRRAAAALGISRGYLYKRIAEAGLQAPRQLRAAEL